jgi:hypothetical protein
MPSPKEYIATGALMQCSQGTVPMPFKATPRTTKISGMQVGNKLDTTPLLNIPSFVICKKLTQLAGGTPTPCVPAPTTWQDTYPVKVGGADALLFRSCINCPAGQGKISFLTSGQLPVPPGMTQALKEARAQANQLLAETEPPEKESVGEAGFWEGMIPIWGSGRDLINSIQTGNKVGMALNGAMLLWDVASVAAGVLSFGTATAAMMGAKAGLRAALKAGTKVALRSGERQLAELALKSAALKAGIKNGARELAEAIGRKCLTACFPAGTLVAVADGYKPIETIKTGDEVWSWDQQTQDLALKPVVQTHQHQANELVTLRVGADVLRATPEHPFWTEEGWQNAGLLQVGSTLQRSDQQAMAVWEVEQHAGPETVYNFEVADWHTYLVGPWMFVVHNECYREVFFKAFPHLRGKVVVHHAVEQQILRRFPNLFTRAEIDAIDNLRGIPNNLNNTLHLSDIRRAWNEFYRRVPTPTKDQVLQYAENVDKRFGHLFTPAK